MRRKKVKSVITVVNVNFSVFVAFHKLLRFYEIFMGAGSAVNALKGIRMCSTKKKCLINIETIKISTRKLNVLRRVESACLNNYYTMITRV